MIISNVMGTVKTDEYHTCHIIIVFPLRKSARDQIWQVDDAATMSRSIRSMAVCEAISTALRISTAWYDEVSWRALNVTSHETRIWWKPYVTPASRSTNVLREVVCHYRGNETYLELKRRDVGTSVSKLLTSRKGGWASVWRNSHPPALKIRRTRLTANCQQFKTLFPRCATHFQRSKHRLGAFLLTFILHFKSETSSSTSLAPHIDSFAPRPHARAHTHAWEHALRHLFLHISE